MTGGPPGRSRRRGQAPPRPEQAARAWAPPPCRSRRRERAPRSAGEQSRHDRETDRGKKVNSCSFLLKSNITIGLVFTSQLPVLSNVFWQRQVILTVRSKSHIWMVSSGKFCPMFFYKLHNTHNVRLVSAKILWVINRVLLRHFLWCDNLSMKRDVKWVSLGWNHTYIVT